MYFFCSVTFNKIFDFPRFSHNATKLHGITKFSESCYLPTWHSTLSMSKLGKPSLSNITTFSTMLPPGNIQTKPDLILRLCKRQGKPAATLQPWAVSALLRGAADAGGRQDHGEARKSHLPKDPAPHHHRGLSADVWRRDSCQCPRTTEGTLQSSIDADAFNSHCLALHEWLTDRD